MIHLVEVGAGRVLEVGKNGPLSKTTKFNHCPSFCQEFLQKNGSPKVPAWCSQQTSLQDLCTIEWCHWQLQDQVVNSLTGAVTVVLNPGKVACESPADYLLSQAV